jgi:membrane-associated phospholipid phosphatase
MGFAAVYLDHHWIVDVLLGLVYCVGAVFAVRFVEARTASRARDPAPAPA